MATGLFENHGVELAVAFTRSFPSCSSVCLNPVENVFLSQFYDPFFPFFFTCQLFAVCFCCSFSATKDVVATHLSALCHKLLTSTDAGLSRVAGYKMASVSFSVDSERGRTTVRVVTQYSPVLVFGHHCICRRYTDQNTAADFQNEQLKK